ncbi:MAG: hypothetical protein ACOYUK_00680 [Patescibacteria group bacterium]
MGRGGEPRPRSVVEELEEEFGLNLEAQFRAIQEAGDAESMGILLKKIETMLIEGGVEMDQLKRQRLREILRDSGYTFGVSDDEINGQ